MKKKFVLFLILIVVVALCATLLVACSNQATLYIYDGDTLLKTIDYTQGDVILEPEKRGKIFAGWYVDAELTKPFDNQKKLSGEHNVYAKWVPAGRTEINVTIGYTTKKVEVFTNDKVAWITADDLGLTENQVLLGIYNRATASLCESDEIISSGRDYVANVMTKGLVIEDGVVTKFVSNSLVDEDIIIPYEYDGKIVHAIGTHIKGDDCVHPGSSTIFGAFEDCYNAKSIFVPNTITTIDDWAFRNVKSTQRTMEITIPSSVESIGKAVFENGSFTKITFENGSKITDFPQALFNNCKYLKEIVGMPSGLKNIGMRAFGDCSALKNITLPNGLQTIGVSAFERCEKLEKIVIPASVNKIDALADGEKVGIFMGCSNDLVVVMDRDYVKDSEIENSAGWASSKKIVWSPITIKYTTADGIQSVATIAQRWQKYGDENNTPWFDAPKKYGYKFVGFKLGDIVIDADGKYMPKDKQAILNAVKYGQLFEAMFEKI